MRCLWLPLLLLLQSELVSGTATADGTDRSSETADKLPLTDDASIGQLTGEDVNHYLQSFQRPSSGDSLLTEDIPLPTLLQPPPPPDCVPTASEPCDQQSSGMEESVMFQGQVASANSWGQQNLSNFSQDENVSLNPSQSSGMLYGYAVIALAYVGSCFSIIGCVLILLTYCIFRELQTLMSQILMNLAITCVVNDLLNLILEPVAVETQDVTHCDVLAFLFQFFLLARFSWMNMMAVELIRTVTQALQLAPVSSKQTRRKLLLLYVIAGWGIPVLVITVTIAVHLTTKDLLYQDENLSLGLCWLEPGETQLFAVGIPLIVSLFFNLLVFVWVVVTLCWIQFGNRVRRLQNRVQIRLYVGVFFALGLTWVLLLLTSESKVFLWLFVALNSMQAFFICLAFICTKKVLQLYIRAVLCLLTLGYSSVTPTRGNRNRNSNAIGERGGPQGQGQPPRLSLPEEPVGEAVNLVMLGTPVSPLVLDTPVTPLTPNTPVNPLNLNTPVIPVTLNTPVIPVTLNTPVSPLTLKQLATMTTHSGHRVKLAWE